MNKDKNKMSIKYLCPICKEKLKISSYGFAVNEVGRKNCEGCGDNQDNLFIVDAYSCEKAIEKYNERNK